MRGFERVGGSDATVAARRTPPRNQEEAHMNTVLWVLQVLAALMYGASGVMKVFMLILIL